MHGPTGNGIITMHTPNGEMVSGTVLAWIGGIVSLLSEAQRQHLFAFITNVGEIPLINGMRVESELIPAGKAKVQRWGGTAL